VWLKDVADVLLRFLCKLLPGVVSSRGLWEPFKRNH
jgi:hypothetical protein